MRIFKWTVVVVAVLIVFLAIFLTVFDWNLLRGYIGEKVTQKTGREFTINGNLDVDFFPFPPRIHAEDLRLANADWGTGKTMLDIRQLDFSVSLLSLWKGNIVLPEVSLVDPQILLEKSIDGKRNWILKQEQSPSDKAPRIDRLTVDKGTLSFRDLAIKTDMTVVVAPVSTTQDARQAGIKFNAQGQFKGQASKAEGLGGKVLSRLDEQASYPLKADLQIGEIRASVDGTVTGLSTFSAVNAQLDVRGNDLSAFSPIIGISLPASPPYQISGHLIRKGDTWEFNKFSGKVGDSDIAGDFSVDVGGEKPFMRGNLVSRKLDLDDLGGIIGAPPQTGAGETSSAAQKKTAQKPVSSTRVLPDKEFKLDRLRAVNVDVKLSVKSITGNKLPLDDLTVHLMLDNGKVTLQPLNFGVAGGNVISNIVLKTDSEPATAQADIVFKRLSLNKLFPTVKLIKTSIGFIGGRAKFTGSGNSFAQLLATADGQAGFSMSGGQISNLLLEIVGIDGAEIIKLLFGGDKTVAVRCMVADFNVKNGLMTTDVFVIDTTDTNISGDGTINLRNESINLTLRPLPKDVSFLSVRSPLFARGTFKHPTFRPDMERVAARTGAAVVLGVLLTPLAAIIPLIETGPGKDSHCGDLIAHLGKGDQRAKAQKEHEEKVAVDAKPLPDTLPKRVK